MTGAFAVLYWLIGWVDSAWLHLGFVEWMPKALQSLQAIGVLVAMIITALVSAWASYVAEAAKQQQTNPNTRAAGAADKKPFWKYLL